MSTGDDKVTEECAVHGDESNSTDNIVRQRLSTMKQGVPEHFRGDNAPTECFQSRVGVQMLARNLETRVEPLLAPVFDSHQSPVAPCTFDNKETSTSSFPQHQAHHDTFSPITQQMIRAPADRRNSDSRKLQTQPLLGSGASTPTTLPDLDLINNPIRIDPTLKALVEEQLADVNSHRSFKLWKSSFLNRFDTYLTEEGSPLALKQYADFAVSVEGLTKYVDQLQNYVERGDLSLDRTTVRGRNALNEMNKCLVELMEQERDLIPARSSDEKRLGYSKFHLAAMLVRDGFREHERLHHCYQVLAMLKETTDLKHIADRQQLDEIENFEKQLIRFRDIMYDIGLLEVMIKSRQYGNPEDELIFVDLKTGALGTVTVGILLEKLVLHRNERGNESPYQEAIIDEEDRQSVLDLVKETLANMNYK